MATDREITDRDKAIAAARIVKPAAVPTGRCLYCNDVIEKAARWCSSECRNEWQSEQDALTRFRGR